MSIAAEQSRSAQHGGSKHGPGYVTIWVWLVGLLTLAVIAAYVPLARVPALTVIFVSALVKAVLVARHYMHLKSESVVIYAIAGVPVLLVLVLACALVPDMIFNR